MSDHNIDDPIRVSIQTWLNRDFLQVVRNKDMKNLLDRIDQILRKTEMEKYITSVVLEGKFIPVAKESAGTYSLFVFRVEVVRNLLGCPSFHNFSAAWPVIMGQFCLWHQFD